MKSKDTVVIICEDHPAAKSLALKLAEQSKPGAIISLTREEWDCFKNQTTTIQLGQVNET